MVLVRMLMIFLALALPAGAQQTRTIAVSGTGTVTLAPDMATVTAGVQAQDRRADDALRKTSVLMAEVMRVLDAAGIAAADIQTSDIALYPQFDNRSPGQGVGIAAYMAQNNVTVRVRDIARLGQVLDAINQAGVNQINGISFGVQDDAEALNEARGKAVADASAKASLYARAAGVVLGPLLSLSEPGTAQPAPGPMFRMEAAAMDVPVAAGETSVAARVDMVFAIE